MGRWCLVVILAITTASTACPAHADEAPPAPEQVTALSPELRQAFRAAVIASGWFMRSSPVGASLLAKG